jgi:arylsulfatase A-like enzyme
MRLPAIFLITLVTALGAEERPNVLWLVLEDTSPHFIGCYGNPEAKTPNIDRLAERGIRFDRAFANAPVCSSARTTIITGTHNHVLGTGHHRSAYPLPDAIKGFPTMLREAGYATYNNSKTDYATSSAQRLILESWSESSNQAGWWKRPAGSPFFAVINYEASHQSRTMTESYDWYRGQVFDKLPPAKRIADDVVSLPPFIPDTPAIRREFARIPNSIALADHQVGNMLARLEKDGLAGDTIIFCYADHGEAMPRGKTNPIGLGYRVPLIVAFPEKWKHLNPWGKPGTSTDELVCFDDLAPTMLSLVGKKPAPWMTGRPILGTHRSAPRPFVFGARNRIDESSGCARSITDGHYLYTRRFLPTPEVASTKYCDVAAIVRELRKPGALTGPAADMLDPGACEVLYDLKVDPWELKNLAADAAHAGRVAEMRQILFRHLLDAGDILLLPEYEIARISMSGTAYEYGRAMTPQRRRAILDAADLASSPGEAPKLLEWLRSEDPVVSYWAAVGMRLHPARLTAAPDTKGPSYPPARIELAAARHLTNKDPEAAEVLRTFALGDDVHLRLHALQRIQDFGPGALDFLNALEACLHGGDLNTRSSAEVTLYRLGKRKLGY